MLETRYSPTKTLPNHWIGVRADWALYSKEPWQHLISVSPPSLRTHALAIGSTGYGKTNLILQLINQHLACDHSIVVLDLRGDLVNAAIELAAGQRVDPSKVKIIDLREKTKPFGFNPLFGAGEPYFRALNVLDVVAQESDSWGIQLAETFRYGLMLLAETGEPLTQLERLFYDSEFRRECIARGSDVSVVSFWQRFDQLSPDRQAALASPVLNKVSLLLATPSLRRILGHRDPINLSKQLNTPGSVTLVSLAVDETHAAGKMMGSIILSSICREIFARVSTPESHRNPVRLFVDEFEHFGMHDFETILAEGRRFNFSVVLAHQTLAQLTPKMRSMILNNVGTKFAFRCGREDSSHLSRDLYGDPRAYDLTDLPVGYALLWQRDRGVVEVEINEPLMKNAGALSPAGSAFLGRVYEYASVSVEPPIPVRVERAPPVPEPKATSIARAKPMPEPKATRTAHVPARSLEDWLCD